MGGLAGQRILLGVSGGIAAYKAADLARRLQDAGAEVQVVMTESAQQFVTAMTFQALTGRPVRSSLWDPAAEAAMGHIELARWASQVLIAPASADFLARLAQGLAGDLLGTICLATEAPITVVPAMNRVMWANAATQANVSTLRGRGVAVLGPGEGDQACGEVGAGRMLEPLEIVEALDSANAVGALSGKNVLISAGPTFEDLDPVRYLGNRSSGKMGFALACEAAAMGARVTLVAGPVSLATPASVRRVDVRRAAQMRDAVLAALPGQDVYISAAAIADYMPAETRGQKIKKTEQSLTLELIRTPDVLSEVAGHPQRPRVVVGFAAETNDVEKHAQEKLQRKGLDMIAANDVSAAGIGFECEDNALVVFSAGDRRSIPRGPKRQVARGLLLLIAERLEPRA
ncbi:MAG: bifunctional phosphopantothenoylcysteine decarboxylase/phosphopantothenate--cysteine ligase CoaBC [Arenimonas sp.]|jgi:phosphopantothenoylcysteine decarboxylase/phosphopantothenate--cysteine ligase